MATNGDRAGSFATPPAAIYVGKTDCACGPAGTADRMNATYLMNESWTAPPRIARRTDRRRNRTMGLESGAPITR